MKSLFRFVFLLVLVSPSFNLFAQMETPLETALQTALSKKTDFVQKETLLKRVSVRVKARVDALIKQVKTSDALVHFVDTLNSTRLPFPAPNTADVPALDTDIRSGKITLQARANTPTPIFYTGGLHNIFGGSTGTGLLLDEYNQIDPLETIALSGTTFQIVGVSMDSGSVIYQVTTPDYAYPTDKGYFIDARFVDVVWMPLTALPERAKHMPSREAILSNLRSSL